VAPPQVLPLSLVWISSGSAFVRALVCSRQSKLAMMNQSISLPPLGSEFYLIASFGRRKYKLCEESAGALLHATLGGVAADF
jgi:hypothetical protein